MLGADRIGSLPTIQHIQIKRKALTSQTLTRITQANYYVSLLSSISLIWTTTIDSGFLHDGRADKNPYPHDRRADKMDELAFYVSSTVFQSFRDDGRVNMKGSVQWSAV